MILLHVTQRIKKSKKMYLSKVVFSSFPCIHVINFFYSYYCYSLWMSETVNFKIINIHLDLAQYFNLYVVYL